MKALVSFALSILALSALAQGPVLRSPGTTNTPAVWTNIVGVISVNSNVLALSQKVSTNETRAIILTNAANVLGGNGAAITGLAGQTNQSNAVTTNDSRALNLSGANIITNASNILGGNGAALTSIPFAALTTAQTTLSIVGTNVTVTPNTANTFYVLCTTNIYFVQPTGLAVGQKFDVHIVQDSTGIRTVTFNTAYWKFPGGFVSAATTNASAIDVISCLVDPYGTNVFVVQAQKFQ